MTVMKSRVSAAIRYEIQLETGNENLHQKEHDGVFIAGLQKPCFQNSSCCIQQISKMIKTAQAAKPNEYLRTKGHGLRPD